MQTKKRHLHHSTHQKKQGNTHSLSSTPLLLRLYSSLCLIELHRGRRLLLKAGETTIPLCRRRGGDEAHEALGRGAVRGWVSKTNAFERGGGRGVGGSKDYWNTWSYSATVEGGRCTS